MITSVIDLPHDVLADIIDLCFSKNLPKLRLVCRTFRDVIDRECNNLFLQDVRMSCTHVDREPDASLHSLLVKLKNLREVHMIRPLYIPIILQENIASKLHLITLSHCQEASYLTYLHHCQNLKTLCINNCGSIHLDVIPATVSKLIVNRSTIRECNSQHLACFQSLRIVELKHCRVTALCLFEEFTNVQELVLVDLCFLKQCHLGMFDNMKRLRSLELVDCEEHLRDALLTCTALTALQSICIPTSTRVNDVVALLRFTSLTHLDIGMSEVIHDMFLFNQLHNTLVVLKLTTLTSGNLEIDLSTCPVLPKLEILELTGDFRIQDWSILTQYTSLMELHVLSNHTMDLLLLKKHPSLRILSLSDAWVQRVNTSYCKHLVGFEIERCEHLRVLDINDCPCLRGYSIQDCDSLATIKNTNCPRLQQSSCAPHHPQLS